MQVDIYFYLDKSSKRKRDFQQFQAEAGTNLHAILKHGPTRWLSLSNCIIRLLEQWEPLKAYFAAEHANLKASQRDSLRNTRVIRVHSFFSSVCSKLYCLFLKENLAIFINANLQLQTEAPQIHNMLKRLDEVVADLLVRFVKPEAITAAPTIFKVPFREHASQKKRQDLLLGESVRVHLEGLKKENLISSEQQDSFSRDVRAFFSEATSYILEKFPLKDKVLHNLQVLDVQDRQNSTISMVNALLEKFPCLLEQHEKESVNIEFAKFQIESFSTDILQTERVDRQWHLISQLKLQDGRPKYPCLSKFMKGLCCLPHSNADSERIFSMVRKNQTVFRSSLSTTTLSALLVQKVNMASTGVPCHQQEFSPSLVAKARRAYALSLKDH
ncbi:hypothetical protein PoB_000984400 [Plakobranchus ocellatus]|uniref:HAT C-terminal dimerisation domain-containing protein n=1 Tax=Plakobranchus ocellatus TaxID=259542 RepID=A0AAV3YJZ4_9GAST|nr:hypothetical protein PoB_000984400 [Plakobranchus ocellatus]